MVSGLAFSHIRMTKGAFKKITCTDPRGLIPRGSDTIGLGSQALACIKSSPGDSALQAGLRALGSVRRSARQTIDRSLTHMCFKNKFGKWEGKCLMVQPNIRKAVSNTS